MAVSYWRRFCGQIYTADLDVLKICTYLKVKDVIFAPLEAPNGAWLGGVELSVWATNSKLGDGDIEKLMAKIAYFPTI